MASIRKIKKDINYLAYELLTEAFTYKRFHPEVEEKKFDDVIKEVVKSRNELISRVNNHGSNGSPVDVTEHFNKIKEDMANMIRIMDELIK